MYDADSRAGCEATHTGSPQLKGEMQAQKPDEVYISVVELRISFFEKHFVSRGSAMCIP